MMHCNIYFHLTALVRRSFHPGYGHGYCDCRSCDLLPLEEQDILFEVCLTEHCTGLDGKLGTKRRNSQNQSHGPYAGSIHLELLWVLHALPVEISHGNIPDPVDRSSDNVSDLSMRAVLRTPFFDCSSLRRVFTAITLALVSP